MDGSQAGLAVRPCRPGDERAWDEFVFAHPGGTFFHLAGWRRVIERAFRHPTHYLIAERSGVITGVLPLTHVKSLLFGSSLISNAFGVRGRSFGSSIDVAGVTGSCDDCVGVMGKSVTSAAILGTSTGGGGVSGISTSLTGVGGTSTDGVGVSAFSTNGAGLNSISTNGAGVSSRSFNSSGLVSVSGSTDPTKAGVNGLGSGSATGATWSA